MFERIMGLNVIDHDLYQKYREHMLPILESYGGQFGYDFLVSDVLKSKNKAKINRVFTIEFPSHSDMISFFNDPDYLEVKAKFLDTSIDNKTVISMHERGSY
ncbi:MAG: DUF1330 domain-containing protein [Acidiferrobacterales bacterium]|nr:DUF1330 domain-containing protein [Acidiferrobacterales bacterium]